MILWGRAIASGDVPLAVMVCSAQTGKTDTTLDVMGERLDNQPAPIIYVGPSKEFNTDQFEPRLMQMFDQCATLSGKLVRGRRMKKTRKIVAGVPVRLAHAGSSTALKSDPAALAIVDEYDEMLANIKGQGDPLGLVAARGHTYADFVTGVASTPTIGASEVDKDGFFWKVQKPEDIVSPIWRLWQSGTMRHWAWPCPQCGDYFIPRFSCLKWSGSTPMDAKASACVACVHCGNPIDDTEKTALNERGVYIAPGQTIDKKGHITGEPPKTSTESYWVSGLCSPFTTFGQLAEAYLAAVQIKDPEKIQTAINSKFGELYKEGWSAGAPKWQDVAEHRNAYFKGDLPDGVLQVVTTIDVQLNRLVYVTRGWGARSTSWLLDWGEFFGETMYDDVWEAVGDYLTHNVCGMPIRAAFIDSGFRPGKRENLPVNKVYDFCRRYQRFVRPTKGASTPMQVPLKVNRNFEVTVRGTGKKFGLELVRLDTDYFKQWVHERLLWPNDELGSWHLPEDVTDEYMKQIVSESRSRLPSGKVVWVVHSPDNHYLDCEAMQAAAAHLLNFARLAPTTKRKINAPPAHVIANKQASAASRLAR
jgi:phage terminase large subunit GpA-like protein